MDEKNKKKPRLFTVRTKFIITMCLALLWVYFITLINIPWIYKLAEDVPFFFAVFAITVIAIIPSFWYSFTLISFLSDTRPEAKPLTTAYPNISVLIAAYNEQEAIKDTVESVMKQEYPGQIEIIVIDDGSTDNTVAILKALPYTNLVVVEANHGGKAAALNEGLKRSSNDILVTIDADTYLLTSSIRDIVDHLYSSLPDVAAVAGSVCVRNSRTNLLTKIQEWNYFNEFISQKRIQSLYQSTLVAQGAFSIFRKEAIIKAGGWRDCVGEDIVLTWSLIAQDYRIGFCETSFAFTNVPSVYKTLFFQRSRWSQGMLEALSTHPNLLFRKQLSTLFIWWNLFIPLIDFGYGFIFMPGLVAAFFGYYYIAGPMTISVIPLILLNNFVFFYKSRKEFKKRNLIVRNNVTGYILFMFLYQPLIMVPAAIHGYISYFIGRKKWGTK